MNAIRYRKGYKYQLSETYSLRIGIEPPQNIHTEFISLTKLGLLTIQMGYAWDGPSGCTVDTRSSMRGALVHDALYQLMRREKLDRRLREVADEIAHSIWIQDGMYRWRAWLWKRALNKFAGFAADPRNDPMIYNAP